MNGGAADVSSDGPYFDDLAVGDRYDDTPAVTLTDGQAASHQMITGDRLRLPLDAMLCEQVLGHGTRALAHPTLVWNIAIGQSTTVTRRVIANLFYRGLMLHRFPVLGDTLRTSTRVTALKQNRLKPQRPATGLAVLRIQTVDQHDRPVLDFLRCAMLPLSDSHLATGHATDLDAAVSDVACLDPGTAFGDWDLGALADSERARRTRASVMGDRWAAQAGDVVSSAPELARLTLNVAAAHHDAVDNGRRLVYGGHTIAIAAAQAARLVPDLSMIAAWHHCDHLAPVFEHDTLRTTIALERVTDLRAGTRLGEFTADVVAHRFDGQEPESVLDWRFTALLAT